MASDNEDEKQLVVRVKRKRLQAPLDMLWVEINDRAGKRQHTDLSHSFGGLTLSSSQGVPAVRKLLFHHVETVNCSDEQKGLLESVLQNTRKDKKFEERHKEQREDIKKPKDKQDQLRLSARQKHEIDAKSARFEQVWRSRRGISECSNDSAINELYHLYDVVRVDEEEMGMKFSSEEKAKREATLHEDQLLCNYLPLLREYLPSAASEFEAQLRTSKTSETDDYVYDVYALEKNGKVAEDVATDYPLVHVEDDEFYCEDLVESDVDSDDSNDENNPLNDYPEEESEIEDEIQSKESFELDEWDDEDGKDYDVSVNDEDDRRWMFRK
ncbi:RNA-directed DNA methylation 4 isoform X2 [Cryptomeria japonica]|uniref:RNA-directed DNA methylation 4 isoform X2 n=1 Tax=Cryptomeria japonica TaxID=3369 RepID=UPI0027DA928B|nr:RNA-directed DNA methylation 4 isoform X2 [Cryptomeria japonica]